VHVLPNAKKKESGAIRCTARSARARLARLEVERLALKLEQLAEKLAGESLDPYRSA
jgi:hypothetical protein